MVAGLPLVEEVKVVAGLRVQGPQVRVVEALRVQGPQVMTHVTLHLGATVEVEVQTV